MSISKSRKRPDELLDVEAILGDQLGPMHMDPLGHLSALDYAVLSGKPLNIIQTLVKHGYPITTTTVQLSVLECNLKHMMWIDTQVPYYGRTQFEDMYIHIRTYPRWDNIAWLIPTLTTCVIDYSKPSFDRTMDTQDHLDTLFVLGDQVPLCEPKMNLHSMLPRI